VRARIVATIVVAAVAAAVMPAWNATRRPAFARRSVSRNVTAKSAALTVAVVNAVNVLRERAV
jgi:hypothetical protein